MVEYTEWMSIGLDLCTSPKDSTEERQRVFGKLAEGWSREKAEIREMTEQEVRNRMECP